MTLAEYSRSERCLEFMLDMASLSARMGDIEETERSIQDATQCAIKGMVKIPQLRIRNLYYHAFKNAGIRGRTY